MINVHAAERGEILDQSQQADLDTSVESSVCTDSSAPSEDNWVEESIEKQVRDTPLHVMKTIVRLSEQRSEKGIQAAYKWYRRQYLAGFKIAVANGGTIKHKRADIEAYTWEKFKKARLEKLPVRGWTIQDWAMERAIELDLVNFKASRCWLDSFKKRKKIRGRKITKTTTRSEREKITETERSIEKFQEDYQHLSSGYNRKSIINFDQTAFQYEMCNLRTLSHQGERDTECEADSINKQTHSYTAQVIISRDGSTVGKLLLCLQEDSRRIPSRTNNSDETAQMFGPQVYQDVDRLQTMYKNIKVFGSSSGKMSAALTKLWLQSVLKPAIQEDRTLILADSWSGQHNSWINQFLDSINAKLFVIPPRTTGDLQPLDVGFNRQYKLIVKRITERARLEKTVGNLTTRAGIINLQSLVFNQLSSPAYRDLIRYSWRKADVTFNKTELTKFPPLNANAIQFDKNRGARCGVQHCEKSSLLRCSHCGKPLCLHHFLDRTCFHEGSPNRLPDFIRGVAMREDDLDDDELYDTIE